MFIENLKLINFRSYKDKEFIFNTNSNTNIILAPNGVGKSNLIEAIYYLSYLRPFRNVNDNELIMKGEKSFFIKGEFKKNIFQNNVSHNTVSVKFSKQKEVIYNNKHLNKYSELLGEILSVLFCNDDIFIIVGQQGLKRKFFDMFISLMDKNYLFTLKKYQIVLKQKNFLLKKEDIDKNLLSAYNWQLTDFIIYIEKKRFEFITIIDQKFKELFNSIGMFKEKSKIVYNPTIDLSIIEDKEKLFNYLESSYTKDREATFMLIGPHRDNYLFLLNGILFSKYGSFGQNRLASLVLKLAQVDLFLDHFKIKPILLFDDVVLELDNERQNNFFKKLYNGNQIFITLTDKKRIPLIDKGLVNEISLV